MNERSTLKKNKEHWSFSERTREDCERRKHLREKQKRKENAEWKIIQSNLLRR